MNVMKALTVHLSLLLLTLALYPASQAGLIDILRGGGENVPPPNAQRVALVGSAEVKEVDGQVERLAGFEVWKRLTPGTRLQPGDLLRTREGSAILKMESSGSLVKVHPATILRLSPLEEGWNRSVLTGEREGEGYVVRSMQGTAFVQSPNGKWRVLRVDSVLPEGAVVRTAAGSTVNLFLTSEQRPIRVAASSRVILNPSLTSGETSVAPTLASATR